MTGWSQLRRASAVMLVFIMCALTSRSGAQCTWQQNHTDSPNIGYQPFVTVSEMTFDSARGRSVLFDPHTPSMYEWDGTYWRLRRAANWLQANASPHWTPTCGMAFDSRRVQSVLLTGPETWEWDGVVWRRRTATGPSVRTSSPLAYDSHRGRTVLFGGSSGSGVLGDTWEWDGAVWVLRSTTGPQPRSGHTTAFDAARGTVVLFGGNGSALHDTWEWDGSSWSQLPASGPAGANYALCYDSLRQRLVLVGGYIFGSINPPASLETWEGDGSSWVRRDVAGPPMRSQISLTFDSARGRAVLFGGLTRSAVFEDTWEWDGETWRQVAPADPSPRTGHTFAYDPDRNVAVLFGGDTTNSDTWTFAGNAWTRLSASGPTARTGHSMVYDQAHHHFVLFGGSGANSSLQDTWVFDGVTWTQRAVSAPPARQRHGMAYDPRRQRIVLFGGQGGPANSPLDDTWEWDGQTWAQIPAPGPSARAGHMMTYDAHLDRVVLVGGESSYGMMDTWEWDGATWRQGPPLDLEQGYYGRYDAGIAFDPLHQRTILFGGYPNTLSSACICQYDGTAWTRGANTGITRRGAPMTYDPSGSRFLLFGGSDYNGMHGDTLELSSDLAPPLIDTQPVNQVRHIGDDVTFSVAAQGTGPLSYQWYHAQYIAVIDGPGGSGPPNSTSPPGGTVSGSRTPTLTIAGVQSPDLYYGGAFYCTISNPCTSLNSFTASLTLLPPCGSADFDSDGLPATDADIAAFFQCLAGNCCATCGSADFNGDGDSGTDLDIESFFRVLAGGSC